MPDIFGEWVRSESDHKGVKVQFVMHDGNGLRIHFDSMGQGNNGAAGSVALSANAICRVWSGPRRCRLFRRFTPLKFYPGTPFSTFEILTRCCPDDTGSS